MQLYLCIGCKAKQSFELYFCFSARPCKPELKVKKFGDLELENAHNHKLFYQIELRDPLHPEHSVPIEVEVIWTHELTLHTKEILQKEKQLVRYPAKNIYVC